MNILIVGAGFVNKGAQSMLFITVDEIYKRCPNSTIYFTTPEDLDMSNYTFQNVYYTPITQSLALKKKTYYLYALKYFFKDCVKYVINRRQHLFKFAEFRKIVNNVDLIIDVSGFNLGEKWDVVSQEMYLNNIRISKEHNIPIYLMPQSFGGFSYSDEKKYLLAEIQEELKYPRIIFAREQQGKDALESTFGLNNVELSYDLVLQNKGINPKKLFRSSLQLSVPDLQSEQSIAIIPNKQCFNHGSKELILNMYQSIVKLLREKGKEIYFFRHSDDDKEICEALYNSFKDKSNLHYIEREFNCLEYDAFIKNFQFIICSRFHGIVHAYRNHVPAIALGWEIKYQELAKAVGQKQFVFDIVSSEKINTQAILEAIEEMCNSFTMQQETIKTCLESIQKNNCFDKIVELRED